VKILIVSQMYPGPADPDLGAFVAQQERALRDRGHEVALAVLDRRAGGKARFLELRRRVRAAATPDVVWAHFLVPSGLFAAEVEAPLVVTAHGRDVRNIGSVPGVARLTRRVVQRAATVIAVSDYLRRELEERLPDARGKTEVIDAGVDLERFDGVAPAAVLEHPAFVHVGSLTDRKNVVRLADAFAADVRRRRATADETRGARAGARRRPGSARPDPGLAERRRRRVWACVDRAVRPGAARGAGVQS
jgi:glycosyltransferase involved in cell wall biosynthesis